MEYIGKKVISNFEEKDGNTFVTFEDGEKLEIVSELFTLIKTEAEQEGELKDVVYDKIGRYILLKLSELGMCISDIDKINMRVINLANNLYKIKIAEKFGVDDEGNIKVKDILK